jgi:Brp/Blh family beta-carotene 15,15'-monooxygenase
MLIITFGILHGCNDLLLIAKENKIITSKSKILVSYTIVLFLFSILFYFFQVLGFTIFILISAYHFGEQHLPKLNINRLPISYFMFRFSYGLLILAILMSFHAVEVHEIIFEIIDYNIGMSFFNYVVVINIVACALLYMYNRKYMNNQFSIVFEVFLILLFSMIFKLTPLIWGFSLYFIIWHSIPSIKSQCEFLYEEFTFESMVKYVKSGSLIWIVSVVSLIAYFFLFNDNSMIETILFCFIAAITFPHVITIFYLFNKKTE